MVEIGKERMGAQNVRPDDDACERMNALLGSIDALVWEGDPDTWDCVYVSPSAEKLLGYPVSAWTDDPQFWLRVMVEEDREPAMEEVARQAALGPDQEVEFRVRAADGRILWVRNSMTSEFDEARKACRVRGVMVDITEMKAAHRRLEESQDRLDSILEAVTEGLMLFHRDGMLVDQNAAAREILGMEERRPALQRDFPPGLRIIDESGTEIPFGDLPAPTAFRTGKHVRDYVMGVQLRSGVSRWVQVNAGPIVDRQGEVEYVIVSLTDISERRAAEADRTMLWRAAEATRTAIGIVSIETGELEYVNPAFTDQTGFTTDELLGSPWTDRFGGGMDPKREAAIRRSLRAGKEWRGEVSNLRKDGSRITAELSIAPVFNNQGRMSQYVVVSDDITQRKEQEQFLRKISSAIEAANVAVIISNLDRQIEFSNAAFARLFAYDDGSIPQLAIADLVADEEERETQRQRWAEVIAGGTWRGEARLKRADGEFFTASLSVAPVVDDTGKVTHAAAIIDDITAQKDLEAQLRQAQKLESVGRLAGGVAHDFNNLLTAIINYASFAADSLDEDDPALDDVKEVLAAGRRASSLTGQLLSFARKQIVEPKLVDVNQSIVDLDKMLRRLLGTDIELVTLPGPDAGLTWIDPGQLEQVIVNMAVNARDAMPDGGKLTIQTSASHLRNGRGPAPAVAIAIADSGVGMTPDVVEQVFEPFFTTKEQGKGTGLGLATCYGIVSQAGGTIDVSSTPGKGTRFRVVLPVAATADVEAVERTDAEVIPHGLETVLVVDDEPLVRNLATRVLRDAGYHVLAASGADEAMAVAAGKHVDLLLTDIVMPRTNGRVLARKFTAQRPDARVLYMSGYADDSALRDEIAAGSASFLQKPFLAVDLATTVRQALDRA